MAFDVRHLEAFHSVVATRSMTASARLLGVSQPAVSSLIARFEQQIGFKLFHRSGGSLEPTEEALRLLEEVAPVLADVEHLGQTIHDIRDGRSGRLMIAAQPLVGLSLLPRVLANFARTHPHVTLKVLTNTSQFVRNLISSHACDLGIAEAPLGTHATTLATVSAQCVCVLPRDHRLAGRATITPALLHGEPFIATFKEREIYHLIGRAFIDAGARWNVVAEVDFFAVACAMVAGGVGVAVVDPFTARMASDQVIVRPFVPSLDYAFAIYHPPQRQVSMVAHEFVRAFVRTVQAIEIDGSVVSLRLTDAAAMLPP